MSTTAAAGRIGDCASVTGVNESSKIQGDKRWRPCRLSGGDRIPCLRSTKPKKTRETAQLPPRPKEPGFVPNIPAVECAICFSPVKEATVPKCGHMFCHKCISDWSEIRSWCPLCQGPVDPLVRIYSVDQQIEFYIGNFSPEERKDLEEARCRREAEQKVRLENEKGIMRRMFREWRHLQLYFMSKGLLHGIGIQIEQGWRSFKRLRFCSMHLVFGILIGLILGYFIFSYWGFVPVHFLKYMFNYRSDWTPDSGGIVFAGERDMDDMSGNAKNSRLMIVHIPATDDVTSLAEQRKSTSPPAHRDKYNLFEMVSPFYEIIWNAWIAR